MKSQIAFKRLWRFGKWELIRRRESWQRVLRRPLGALYRRPCGRMPSVVISRPWSRDSSALEFILSRSRSRDLMAKVSVLVSRPKKRSWQQHWECRTCYPEVAGLNLTRSYCALTPTQRAIPSWSIDEYQRKLGGGVTGISRDALYPHSVAWSRSFGWCPAEG